MTFSIVAYDPRQNEWGVAIQSKFFAVGIVCPWARADAGALVTQAHGDPALGWRGLELLAGGRGAEEVLRELLQNDDRPHLRQIAIVDRDGRTAAHTGKGCSQAAGHLVGRHHSCQANLVFEGTLEAMDAGFRRTPDAPLEERFLNALESAQLAGGDRRGQQSAAMLIVKKDSGYLGVGDRRIDLRIDDDPRPVAKLRQLVHRRWLFHEPPDSATFEPIERFAPALLRILGAKGEERPLEDAELEALSRHLARENLTARWDRDRLLIDPAAVHHLEEVRQLLDGSSE